jgi:rare lipoprotein A
MLLPLAGPAQADPRVIHLAVNAAALPDAPESILPAPLAEPVAAPQFQAPQFQTIGSGMASYYGRHFAGARTASGQRFDPDGLTAAHRTLPFGTKLLVTNPRTGQSVTVTVNDRGPWHGNRVLDLSDAAAAKIGIVQAGSGMVQMAVMAPND